jgi:hypothetical protein
MQTGVAIKELLVVIFEQSRACQLSIRSPENAPPTTQEERGDPGKPCRDPLRLARYYQSLLDSGKFESRAALARFLGVSRANVAQVLNRLRQASDTFDSIPMASPDESQQSCVGIELHPQGEDLIA